MTVDIDALLAKASLPTATAALCLDSDLHQRWEDSERAARAAADDLTRKHSGSAPTTVAALAATSAREAADALRAEVDAASLRLTFRALPAARFEGLRIQHPPRKDVPTDRVQHLNPITFFPALIAACTVDPVMSAEQWDRLLDVITDRQLTELADVVDRINRRETTSVPFSSPASGTTTD